MSAKSPKRSGIAVSALHFYEAKGLIRSRRTNGNQRRYPRDVLRRVAVIKVAQRTGVPLLTIRKALQALPQDKPPTAADWREALGALEAASSMRASNASPNCAISSAGCIGCGCMSLKVCPLRNPMDELGRDGTGPRLLESTNEA